MRILVLALFLVIVPDTTIRKKPEPKPLKSEKVESLKKLNAKQAKQMIMLDSLIKVSDTTKKK